ncbi:DNA-processing protein DprA [Heliorestis convoluta]|uniref:DNA processing protein DprA n=1 Tax=Heliorestis convoluta TaxID=356322 RepID=A0A5Q2MZG4_9FIRM|nr:DNA-processing protein DprA [Heliorestis convoluta]QGG48158.1 DNA processing protein DprA [Heliorestis convoluta]
MHILSESERTYWLALASLPAIGARRFHSIIEHFGSPQAAWLAPEKDWDGVAGMSLSRWQKTLQYRRKDYLSSFLERIYYGGIEALTLQDERYPELLRSIPDPPPVLYMKGQIQERDKVNIAIVGTRKATPYGEKVCSQLTEELVQQERTIVSGLARGIDAIAHRTALEKGGRTIAVLACGLDKIYPKAHEALAAAITERGALISEYPPGSPAEPGKFPARNRIISGLSQGVLVIEAGEKSGALITADQALEQGREVFAVPGPITSSQSKGTHRLIQQGAKLVTSIEDILSEVQIQFNFLAKPKQEIDLEPNEKKLLSHLDWEGKTIDQLIHCTGLKGPEIAVLLTHLEMKGMIKSLPGGGHFVSLL